MKWDFNRFTLIAVGISVLSLVLYVFTGFPYLFFFIPFSFFFPRSSSKTVYQQPPAPSQFTDKQPLSEYCWNCGYHFHGFEAFCPICGAKRT